MKYGLLFDFVSRGRKASEVIRECPKNTSGVKTFQSHTCILRFNTDIAHAGYAETDEAQGQMKLSKLSKLCVI
jgi:hypothetical protein